MRINKILIIVFVIMLFSNVNVISSSRLELIDSEQTFIINLEKAIKGFFSEKDREKIKITLPEIKSYNIISGYIPYIKVKASNVFIDDLRTEYIYMYLYNIRLDTEKLIKENKFLPGDSMKIRFHAEISENNINELLEKKKKKIKVNNPKAVLREDHIYLYGNVKAAFLSSNIKAKGRFYIENEKKINFYAEYISMERVKIPKFLLVKIVNTINPVIDLEKNRFDVRVSRIEINNDKFIISSFKEDEVEYSDE